MSRVSEQDKQKWETVVARTYQLQARFFLNAYWKEFEADAEPLWKFVQLAGELDKKKKAEGNELDEFEAHQFLEKLGETLTVQEMRAKMREIDLDFNKKMSMLEFLIFKYKKQVPELLSLPQGGENKEEMAKAEAMVNAAQEALQEMQQKLEAQKQALQKQQEAEAEAKKAKDAAEAAESAALSAEAEQKATLEELERQQESLKQKMAELEKKSQEGSTVQKGRAVQELEQLRAEDPLPLQRAKINQGAAVRKAERARKFATEEADKARAAAAAAAEAVKASEEATRQVEAAVDEAQGKVEEATKYLEEVKAQPGQAMGDIWWLERELKEKKKYLPQRLQK